MRKDEKKRKVGAISRTTPVAPCDYFNYCVNRCICADSPFIDSIKFPLQNAGQTEFKDFEIVPGPVIDVNLIVDWCMEQMRIYDVKKIAMDTYRYTLFKQAFEERGISIEDKKNPHGIVRLIRKISSATGIIAPFIQSMFARYWLPCE